MRVATWVLVPLLLVGCPKDEDPEPADDLPATGGDTSDAGTPPDPPPIDLEVTEERAVCADRNPLRNVYFGDTHVHTGLSFDARVYEIHTGPADAYRFAKGETVHLPPLDEDGKGTRPLALEVPLDFTAVTDHAEYLAEVQACITEGSPAYDSELCQTYRKGGPQAYVDLGVWLAAEDPKRPDAICGEGLVDCPAEAKGIWAATVAAAEEHDDKTEACSFTAFAAYEYTSSAVATNLHRNVIFRNATVPELPITYFEEPTTRGLWTALEAQCREAGTGCDVLAIPHNANWSNGNMFHVEYPGATTIEEERAQAEQRVAMEPLYEVYQHKGESECRRGAAWSYGLEDELCDFEKLKPADVEACGDTPGSGGIAGVGCVSRRDFVRNVLSEGLAEQERLGVNPFRLGLIAATDTHAAIPGHVSESNWKGHLGIQDDEPAESMKTVSFTPGGIVDSPGGLAAVWAVENSRDAIFEALRRRETYATSGPRIVLRFFAGADLADNLCEDPAMLERAYAGGVPMGGEVTSGERMRFLISALRDPRDTATPLQRIQIVKGWLDTDGAIQLTIYEVAGDKDNGATVDTSTCERSGPGEDGLCTVWEDPDYDPTRPAFWYARVLENPSCRWNTWWCNRLDPADRPPTCDDPDTPKTLQERAWSSPIWHTAG